MNEKAVERVRQRRKELSDEIARLESDLHRLDAYLQVHEEFNRPPERAVSGKEIDALCQMVLRRAGKPLSPAQLVAALKDEFGVVVDSRNPARLVSTRMSTLASVESTEAGWQLVSSGIEPESEAYK